MPHARLDFQHARRIHAGAFANARRRFARHHAALGQHVGGGQFDFQPALEPALIGPDRAHLRASVARNHAGPPTPLFVQVFIMRGLG